MTDSHQMYEAESGEFVLAATGDSMIARPLSSFREERFTGLIDVLRGADAAFTNLEMQIHRYEPYPAANSGGLWTAADTDAWMRAQTLSWDMARTSFGAWRCTRAGQSSTASATSSSRTRSCPAFHPTCTSAPGLTIPPRQQTSTTIAARMTRAASPQTLCSGRASSL